MLNNHIKFSIISIKEIFKMFNFVFVLAYMCILFGCSKNPRSRHVFKKVQNKIIKRSNFNKFLKLFHRTYIYLFIQVWLNTSKLSLYQGPIDWDIALVSAPKHYQLYPLIHLQLCLAWVQYLFCWMSLILVGGLCLAC